MDRYVTTTYGIATAIITTAMAATYAICTGDLRSALAGGRFWTVTETPTGWDVAMYRRGHLAYARNIYTLKNLTRSRAEEALTILRARGEIIQKEL